MATSKLKTFVKAKEYDCNACGHARCAGDYKRLKHKAIFVGCPGHVELQNMRRPLLEVASEHDGWMEALAPTLEALNLRLEEMDRYPGFRFVEKQ